MQTLNRTLFFSVPKSVQAAHVEKAGTYQLEDIGEVTVDRDDVYLVWNGDAVSIHTGKIFRSMYQPND